MWVHARRAHWHSDAILQRNRHIAQPAMPLLYLLSHATMGCRAHSYWMRRATRATTHMPAPHRTACSSAANAIVAASCRITAQIDLVMHDRSHTCSSSADKLRDSGPRTGLIDKLMAVLGVNIFEGSGAVKSGGFAKGCS